MCSSPRIETTFTGFRMKVVTTCPSQIQPWLLLPSGAIPAFRSEKIVRLDFFHAHLSRPWQCMFASNLFIHMITRMFCLIQWNVASQSLKWVWKLTMLLTRYAHNGTIHYWPSDGHISPHLQHLKACFHCHRQPATCNNGAMVLSWIFIQNFHFLSDIT